MSVTCVLIASYFFFALILHPPRPTLFPYTTLFRSVRPDQRLHAGFIGRQALFLPCRASQRAGEQRDRKSTRLNSSHANISYAVFCLKKKNDHPGVLQDLLHEARHRWQRTVTIVAHA